MGILSANISKLQSKLTKADNEIKKFEAAKVRPSEFFTKQEYSQFDATGFPTHTADGKEVSSSAQKRLKKIFTVHQKNHEQYLEKERAAPDFLQKLKEERDEYAKEIEQLTNQLNATRNKSV